MVFILDHFRCHVLECSTKSVTLLHVIRLNTPPKITNLYNVSILDKDILWLDVSMNQALLMQVVNTGAYLNEKVKGSIFAKILLFTDQIE